MQSTALRGSERRYDSRGHSRWLVDSGGLAHTSIAATEQIKPTSTAVALAEGQDMLLKLLMRLDIRSADRRRFALCAEARRALS